MSMRLSALFLILAFMPPPVSVKAQDAASGNSTTAPATAEADPSRPQSESAEALLREMSTKEMVEAIDGGLQALAAMQEEGKGTFPSNSVNTAISSLAGLAFLASGSTADSGVYSNNISRIVEYLLSIQDPNNGFFSDTARGDGSRIHGHGYATLFLSQVYGQSGGNSANLRRALTVAVNLLESGQTRDGGWGYMPDDLTWDEGSTTVCALQALRAAQQVGISVKNTVIAKAIGYLEKIATPQTFKTETGEIVQGHTFMYSLGSGQPSTSYSLCAAACACMNNVGIYSGHARWNERNIGAILDGGMRWLRYQQQDFFDRYHRGDGGLDVNFFHYGQFYAVQAAWQYADVQYFKYIFPELRDLLIKERSSGGGWPDRNYGGAYTTALSLLILQLPYQYLPAYQR